MKGSYSVRLVMGVFCLLLLTNSDARIKLITLPVREHIEIQLQNEHITIIEEERIVPLKQGINDIDFSWHNSSIRPETIVFRVLADEQSPRTNILSVSYPPNESALTWQLSASKNGSARVRISYEIERLDKEYHYVAYVDADEQLMQLRQYIKVNNQSGEAFTEAYMNTGMEQAVLLPLDINETQEFLNQSYAAVNIEKTYTVNAAQLGYRNRAQDKLNVYMYYRLHNDTHHKLGKQVLAPGKFRIYQQDNQGSSVFIGEDRAKFTAKNDELSLFIGEARDIVVKRIIERKKHQKINGNLYNIDVLVKYEIENFKEKAVNLIIEESLPYLRNEVFSSRNSLLEWQIGEQTNFRSKPLKKRTHSEKIAYRVHLPAKTDKQKVMKLERKLNINFKNEW